MGLATPIRPDPAIQWSTIRVSASVQRRGSTRVKQRLSRPQQRCRGVTSGMGAPRWSPLTSPLPLGMETALTESAESVSAELHEALIGSRPDGTTFSAGAHRTCSNWTSSQAGSAQVGYVDRTGDNPNSWNSAQAINGCSEQALHSSGSGAESR
jgi:hypothetical protein